METNFKTKISGSKIPRVVELIGREISNGKYQAGTLLPPERYLASKYSVSRPTIRKAVSFLAAEGRLRKVSQRGVMVPVNTGIDKDKAKSQKPKIKRSIATLWAAKPDAHVTAILAGITRYTEEHGLKLRMFMLQEKHLQENRILEHIESYGSDGIIIHPYATSEYKDCLHRLAEQNFPVVCLDRQVMGIESSSVEADNASGMYQATHHIITKCRRPAYYLGLPPDVTVIKQRYEGYCNAMADAGYSRLVRDYTYIYRKDEKEVQYSSVEEHQNIAFEMAKELFDKHQPPLSIVCMNDCFAHGIYELAEERNLTIGKDIAIVGFDDLPMAALMEPALTTIHQPREEMGYEVAKLLHNTIEGNIKVPIHMHLPVELVIRKSV